MEQYAASLSKSLYHPGSSAKSDKKRGAMQDNVQDTPSKKSKKTDGKDKRMAAPAKIESDSDDDMTTH